MTTTTRRTELIADLGLFYAAAIWGSTFIIVKDALNGIDPLTMVGYRFLIAGFLLLAYLIIKRRPLFTDWKKALFVSVILWFLYVPQTVGLKYTTASNSGFITGLFVVFIPLFLITLFKRKPTRWEIIASFVSLAGLWILTGGLKRINVGDSLTLVAAVTYALHVLYSDKYMK
ncbi:MAG: DMT family transporter, partial [candidate division Zixibacteria bacterium]|nr:DMT family transporter [candidate division Zixibacteria bacterium]